MKLTTITVCLVTLFMISCNNDDKKAENLLNQAEKAYANGQYNNAKILIDSIKKTYPKSFDARMQSIKLLQNIEISEQKKTLSYIDSTRTILTQKFNEIKDKYKFIKNDEYQDYGIYIDPKQDLSKNINKDMLYAYTDELGTMKITSIYCGNHSIDHNRIKAYVTNGNTFTETKQIQDPYYSKHLGIITEKVEYEIDNTDNGLINYIISNKDNKIMIEYIGKSSFKRQLTKTEIEAICMVYDLSRILHNITEANTLEQEANNRMNFYSKKQKAN